MIETAIILSGVKYISIKDYANKYDITERTVYNRITDGKIETKKFLGKTIVKDK